MRASQESATRPWSAERAAVVGLQVVLGLFTPLALISFGGLGIYSAPVVLPLLWVTARASKAARYYFLFLAALMVGEVAWAVVWVLPSPLEAVLAVGGAAIAVAVFALGLSRPLGPVSLVVGFALLALVGGSGVIALSTTEAGRTVEIEVERVDR